MLNSNAIASAGLAGWVMTPYAGVVLTTGQLERIRRLALRLAGIELARSKRGFRIP